MNITLKNIKIAAFLSQETLAFAATIYVDGKRVGTVENDGHGGANTYRFEFPTGREGADLEKRMEEFVKTQPRVFPEFENDLDTFIGKLVDDHENKKRMASLCKKKTLFLLEGDNEAEGWRTIKAPYDVRVQAFLDKNYGSKVVRILNKEIV